MKISLIPFLLVSSVAAKEGTVRGLYGVSGSGAGIHASVCFSEVATTQVFGKGPVEMRDLQVGDRVFTGEDYHTVYAFGHLDKAAKAEFLQIHTDKDSTLEVTVNHLVYVDGRSAPVRADSIKVGDFLQGAAVTKIGAVERNGLYAPLTTDGNLVVDGVKASSYISLDQIEDHAFLGKHIQTFSHFGISPFRLMCTGFSPNMCQDYNEDGIPRALAFLNEFLSQIMDQPCYVQAIAIVSYFLLAAMAWTMEYVMAAPSLIVFGAILVAVNKQLGIRVRASAAKKAA